MPAARLKVGLDTSCLVALFAVDHVVHALTLSACERLRSQNAQFVVPTHSLLECFSVLTRMPPSYRMSPDEVERLLVENFSEDAEVPGVTPAIVWSCMRELVLSGVARGGMIYDAVIAHAAFQAGAAVILTWNVRHLVLVAPAGLEVSTPADYSARAPRIH